MIKFAHSGDFSKTEKFLLGALKLTPMQILEMLGRKGVRALSNATPIDDGETANSWSYEVLKTPSGYSLIFSNSSSNQGIPIVILLQYGHGTSSGTFVQGRDFINPALKPVADELSEDLWKEVLKL